MTLWRLTTYKDISFNSANASLSYWDTLLHDLALFCYSHIHPVKLTDLISQSKICVQLFLFLLCHQWMEPVNGTAGDCVQLQVTTWLCTWNTSSQKISLKKRTINLCVSVMPISMSMGLLFKGISLSKIMFHLTIILEISLYYIYHIVLSALYIL
jgi:hypothetical protein